MNGEHLSEIWLTHNLKFFICRGVGLGELTGELTCFKQNGDSVVDLLLAHENLQRKVNYLKSEIDNLAGKFLKEGTPMLVSLLLICGIFRYHYLLFLMTAK